MAQEDAQERTERPTPKRLREAREKGQVPRSRELGTLFLLLAGAGGLLLTGPHLAGGMEALLVRGLRLEAADVLDPAAPVRLLARAVTEAALALAPLLALLVAAAVAAPLVLGGWVFSTETLMPKWERIDPVRGLRRVFSLRGLIELVKALAKFAVIATVAVVLLWRLGPALLGLGQQEAGQAVADAAALLAWAFLGLAASTLLIAAVDVPFQLWDHTRQLRMTRQEVRDELKETEGKPEVRARQRERQREIARRRMMAEVPKADVVVTNPTHFAVALRYRPERMRAPQVVAKGTDLVAAQIRGVAARAGVPQFEAPPLARALYYSTEVGQEIPAALYVAVAQVLAWVYQVDAARREGREAPARPQGLEVPDELTRPGAARAARRH
ncbi:flagellar biosynthesis protein FlhB [Inmirania thermothiophila]|uniref:Flagellar biosynthetic protein FlhB n=1 Tax=Inmirania thermothiophila TaxID=1750597 RepID=A0A3N1YBB5_9GAMM|nr:flagellar biosynthesis protein FlhB [Inmirania thermothiophila]ROR34942.1 flagellar biosynthetic protein FlhB [Inmirania thermothiophila]